MSAALVAVLAACGGSAIASEPEPDVAPTATEAPVDVEAIARDEIAALHGLGYPTDLATFDFQPEYTNSAGGTATTWQEDGRASRVQMSIDPDGYAQWGPDIETSIRSTVRHELGHAWTYYLFPQGAEGPLSQVCMSTSEKTLATGTPGSECAAEAVSALLTEQRGGARVAFYDLELSGASVDSLRPIVAGSLTWDLRGI